MTYEPEPTPREQAQYLRMWLRGRWGEFAPQFETALCNAAQALEVSDPDYPGCAND